MPLLPSGKSVILPERVYFSSPRNESFFKRGWPLVFYESGSGKGRSCAIAVARVIETVVVRKGDISASLLRYGVLEESQIEHLTVEDTIAVTTFDNIMLFKKDVPLQKLREIGCVNAANLVCPVRLTPQQLMAVITEGEPSA